MHNIDDDRIKFLRERLREYHLSQDNSGKELFYLYSELGIAYRKEKDLAEAEKYLRQAETLFNLHKSLISQTDQANLYYNLGRLYQEKIEQGKNLNYLEQQKLAIAYLEKAIILQRRLKLNLSKLVVAE